MMHLTAPYFELAQPEIEATSAVLHQFVTREVCDSTFQRGQYDQSIYTSNRITGPVRALDRGMHSFLDRYRSHRHPYLQYRLEHPGESNAQHHRYLAYFYRYRELK